MFVVDPCCRLGVGLPFWTLDSRGAVSGAQEVRDFAPNLTALGVDASAGKD
jgi:hypothetical protein